MQFNETYVSKKIKLSKQSTKQIISLRQQEENHNESQKALTAITSIALASVMLAGCFSSNSGSTADGNSSASGDSTAAGDAVNLTVLGSQENQEMLKKMCEEFAAANPEKQYTFTFGVVSEADAQKEVLKDISAAADVFGFASDQTATLVGAGALYRVTKNNDEIVANNTEASIFAATINGELYGYPCVTDTYFMSKHIEEDVQSIESIATLLARYGKASPHTRNITPPG